MIDWSAARERLAHAASESDPARRVLRTAAVISDALRSMGLHPVLVGGGAVEIYTSGAYTTQDLDFIAESGRELDAAMDGLGFERSGRVWVAAALGLVVEFPGTVLAPAIATSIDVEGSELAIIAPEDLVIDRLAAWKHWGWDADGAAAGLLLASMGDEIDRDRLASRAAAEDVEEALGGLRGLLVHGGSLSEERLKDVRRSWRRATRSDSSVRAPGDPEDVEP